MIDGVKIAIRGRAQERLRSHAAISWVANGTDKHNRPRYTGRWGGFIFQGDAARCWRMRGSFHCYSEGGTNADAFTLQQLSAAVEVVCVTLGLHPSALRIENIEFGVNIEPPIPTQQVLACIVMHKGASPAQLKGADTGHGIEIQHAQYRFKIYDKARHCNRDGEVMRYELAASKMAAVRRAQISTLADVLDPVKCRHLADIALERFDELLILEPGVVVTSLSDADRLLFTQAGSREYWAAQKRSTRSDRSRRVEQINNTAPQPRLRDELRARIAAAFEYAIGPADRTFLPRVTAEVHGVTLRTELPRVITPAEVPAAPRNRTMLPLVIKGKNVRPIPAEQVVSADEVAGAHFVPSEALYSTGHASTLTMDLDDPAPTIPGPPCATCGKPTGSTRAGSKFCSATVYGEKAAKKCRNADSNPRNNHAAALARVTSAPVLFDQTGFITLQHRPIHHGHRA